MACSACRAVSVARALGQAASVVRSTGLPSWWPYAAVGGAAALVGVLWTMRDRCPEVYDDYVVGVRTRSDRLRRRAVLTGRKLKCDWTRMVRR